MAKKMRDDLDDPTDEGGICDVCYSAPAVIFGNGEFCQRCYDELDFEAEEELE